MDNNTAERMLRNPVVGRKNYYGSGSVWSAHLAARMFSVLQTILLWGLLIPSDFVVHSFRPPMEEAMSRLWSQLG